MSQERFAVSVRKNGTRENPRRVIERARRVARQAIGVTAKPRRILSGVACGSKE